MFDDVRDDVLELFEEAQRLGRPGKTWWVRPDKIRYLKRKGYEKLSKLDEKLRRRNLSKFFDRGPAPLPCPFACTCGQTFGTLGGARQHVTRMRSNPGHELVSKGGDL